MEFKQFYLGCLAHASYLVGSDGEAAVVDPQRDVEQYIEEASARGLTITAVIETHLHADFVSGHRELAARTGARIYVGHRAGAAFAHVPVRDGTQLRLGSITLRFIETPGHTPEGISILVFAPGATAPAKILTGDTLFIGDVGRPDLAGSRGHTAEQMAGMMYDTLRDKILPLPDAVEVYPAHGAGSACGRFMSSERSSTLGEQRRTNWALQPMSRDEFVARLTSGLSAPPRYFGHDAELNRRGAAELGELAAVAALSPDELVARQRGGALVLDVRDVDAFGRGHVPGAINLGLAGAFAPWAGTLIEVGTPIVLVGEDDAQVHEATVRLARVGLETVVGQLAGGMAAWTGDGWQVARLPQMTVQELHALIRRGAPLQLVDVRRLAEHVSGHAPGARHIPLDELEARVGELDRDRRTHVMCGTGYRSSAACGLLARRGFSDLVNITGGHGAWDEAGLPLSRPEPPTAPPPATA
jgi:glyoxylase-like metal-dependent hydrolase (beta-lactamase superfamily II)/rhodanese-related sulfurtransferase